MDFDRYIKQIAREEPIATPGGYDERVRGLLASLAPQKQKQRARRKLPLAAAVTLAILLVCGTAFAVNLILKMQGSDISYFGPAPAQDYSSQQAYLERNSDKVGMELPALKEQLGAAITDATGKTEGFILTIDNIAMDVNYLTVFYTVHSDQSLRDVIYENYGDGYTEDEFNRFFDSLAEDAGFIGASLDRPLVDGRNFEFLESGGRGGKSYLKDDHTFSGTQAFALAENIPETFTLTLGTEFIFGREGKWQADFKIDLSGANQKAKIAYPQTEISVKEIFSEDTANTYGLADYTHKVVVERVSLTENGGMIVLGEEISPPYPSTLPASPAPASAAEDAEPAPAMDDPGFSVWPYTNFLVYDQDGNSLGRAAGSGGVYGGTGYVRNILEFAADMDTTSVTLVPYTVGWENPKEVRVMFDELGKSVEIFPGASVTLTDVSLDSGEDWDFGEAAGSDCVTIKYIEKGVTLSQYAKTRFLGKDGREVRTASTVTPENPYVDFSTGTVTNPVYVTFPDDAPGDIRSFTGMIFEYDLPIPDEANRHTIPLP